MTPAFCAAIETGTCRRSFVQLPSTAWWLFQETGTPKTWSCTRWPRSCPCSGRGAEACGGRAPSIFRSSRPRQRHPARQQKPCVSANGAPVGLGAGPKDVLLSKPTSVVGRPEVEGRLARKPDQVAAELARGSQGEALARASASPSNQTNAKRTPGALCRHFLGHTQQFLQSILHLCRKLCVVGDITAFFDNSLRLPPEKAGQVPKKSY